MIVLPLLYLFWWKKRWRLLLGVIISIVLVIGYLLPSEFAYSILATETDKEKPVQKLEEALKNISSTEPNPTDSEKVKLEKLMVSLQRKIEELAKKGKEEEGNAYYATLLLRWKKREWIRKWGKKEKSPTFLLCGEQFNEELRREGKKGGIKWKKVEDYNIIDFGQSENNEPESLKKKLKEICKQNGESLEEGHSPIVWLKNIDKTTNSELKKELLKIVDPNQKSNLGEYYEEIKEEGKTKRIKMTIDLSQFTLVATTSTTNPQLSKELRAKLKPIEPFFDKYFWAIFCSSIGMEIIVFFLLIRSRKKSKNKSLKRFEY